MRNRSKSALPSSYAYIETSELNETRRNAFSLEIYDITYMHFHSSVELGVCCSGQGICMVEDKEYAFKAGDVQIIFPFQRHLSRSSGGYSQWIWTCINPIKLLGDWGAPDIPRLERLLNAHMALCGIIDREKYPLIAELVRRVTLPGGRDARLSCLCALIEELAAQSEGLQPLALRPEYSFLRLEPALRYVQDSLDHGKSPRASALATACAMSDATFRREFERVMGRSPREYIQFCQLQRARKMLLLGDESITQIALSVGYQDVSGFNRQFISAFGITPREYRRCDGDIAQSRTQSIKSDRQSAENMRV